jgi:hypothetical protein
MVPDNETVMSPAAVPSKEITVPVTTAENVAEVDRAELPPDEEGEGEGALVVVTFPSGVVVVISPSGVVTSTVPSGAVTSTVPSGAVTSTVPSGVVTSTVPSGLVTSTVPSGLVMVTWDELSGVDGA